MARYLMVGGSPLRFSDGVEILPGSGVFERDMDAGQEGFLMRIGSITKLEEVRVVPARAPDEPPAEREESARPRVDRLRGRI